MAEGPGYELLLAKGTLKRKTKNNNGFYKQYSGAFASGIPQGPDGEMELRLSAWPKQHVLVNQYNRSRIFCFKKSSLIYKGGHRVGLVKRLAAVKGAFAEGWPEG